MVSCFADTVNAALYGKSGFVPIQAPNYVQFYDIDTTEFSARFKPISAEKEKALSGTIKESYKKIKKIEKYINERNFEKAVSVDANFLPAHVKYLNYCIDKSNYHCALNEIITLKRINSVDRVLDDDVISYKLGMLYYVNKNYQAALTYLSNFADNKDQSDENLWYVLGDVYLNLKNYEASIDFAKRIPSTSVNYLSAQKVLYSDYIATNNISAANACARVLVQREPVSANYFKLADSTRGNDNEQLAIYYRARKLALDENDFTSLAAADGGIALLEQARIDNAVKTLKGFVVKPDWQKILSEVGAITDPMELSNRQANFFKSTNYCIQNFSDRDLIKCFEHVNSEEEKASNEKLEQYKRAYEEQQREYEMMRRQQEFLQRTYYNRMYMDEFYYMRQPYNYFYGNLW